mmetsp:Transcript_25115/g.82367  ORF Transcript_25115/g.82367 Transcript_25115/m.82367 type:complete len:98 (+) Transcript_25115:323-616(+)
MACASAAEAGSEAEEEGSALIIIIGRRSASPCAKRQRSPKVHIPLFSKWRLRVGCRQTRNEEQEAQGGGKKRWAPTHHRTLLKAGEAPGPTMGRGRA